MKSSIANKCMQYFAGTSNKLIKIYIIKKQTLKFQYLFFYLLKILIGMVIAIINVEVKL